MFDDSLLIPFCIVSRFARNRNYVSDFRMAVVSMTSFPAAIFESSGLQISNQFSNLPWHYGVLCRFSFGIILPTARIRCQPHSIPLERQLQLRRAWRLVRFGNIHSPGGASCKDCGDSLPPLRY